LSQFKNIPAQTAVIQRTGNQKMLWAFYYFWYYLKSWADPRLRDRPLIAYVSNDNQAIARQIDGFVSSWCGPGDFTDRIMPSLLNLAEQKNFHI
jgi:thiol-disulfide isomerase/thioredoxin